MLLQQQKTALSKSLQKVIDIVATFSSLVTVVAIVTTGWFFQPLTCATVLSAQPSTSSSTHSKQDKEYKSPRILLQRSSSSFFWRVQADSLQQLLGIKNTFDTLQIVQSAIIPTRGRLQQFLTLSRILLFAEPVYALQAIDHTAEMLSTIEYQSVQERLYDSALIHLARGLVAFEQLQFKRGMHYDSLALMIGKQIGNKKIQADALMGLATHLYFIGNAQQKAFACAFQARALYEEIGDSVGKGFALNRIASIQRQYKEYEEAQQEIVQALRIFEKYREYKGIAYASFNAGTIYLAQRRYDSAQVCLERALHAFQEIGSNRGTASAIHDLGMILAHAGRYDEAVEYLRIAVRMFDTDRLHTRIINSGTSSMLELGACLTKLGRFDEALPYLQRGLNNAQQMEFKRGLRMAFDKFADYYEAQGNTQQALYYRNQYIALHDSLTSAEWASEMSNVKSRYALERQQVEIALLNQRQETQRLALAAIIGVLLLVSVLLLVLANRYQFKRRSELRYKEQNIQLQEINAELHQLNTELDAANAFKSEMLSIVAHDLKNPLTSVALGSELVLKALQGIAEASQSGDNKLRANLHAAESIVKRIFAAAQHMNNLVNDLLDAAAAQLGKMDIELKEVALVPLLQELVEFYRERAAQKQQTIMLQSDGECILPQADKERLHQAFDNLLSNAVKYSVLGGVIEVVVQANSHVVRVAIRDQGPGISKTDKEKMFRYFQRLSAQPTGGESSTGLGLAIVKQIVELHHGRVWVESEPELGRIGAEFIVELPLTVESKTQEAQFLS